MSDRFRRTFEFTAEHKAALDIIKRQLGVKTDTAAINYAVKLAAHLSTRKAGEVDQALWLRDELGRRVKAGGILVIEKVINEGAPPARAELLLPPFGLQEGEQPSRPQTNASLASGYDALDAAA